MDYIVHGVAESDTTERLSLHFTSFPRSRKLSISEDLQHGPHCEREDVLCLLFFKPLPPLLELAKLEFLGSGR